MSIGEAIMSLLAIFGITGAVIASWFFFLYEIMYKNDNKIDD